MCFPRRGSPLRPCSGGSAPRGGEPPLRLPARPPADADGLFLPLAPPHAQVLFTSALSLTGQVTQDEHDKQMATVAGNKAVELGRKMRRRTQSERAELEEQSERLANLCQEGWNLVIKDLVNSAVIPEVVIGARAWGRAAAAWPMAGGWGATGTLFSLWPLATHAAVGMLVLQGKGPARSSPRAEGGRASRASGPTTERGRRGGFRI